MSNVKNESGILNARKGRYKGKEYVFTHRDPKKRQGIRRRYSGWFNIWKMGS